MVFVLTASIGQGLAYLMTGPRRSRLRATASSRIRPVLTPVAVESVPQVDFPKSLNKGHLENFSVPLTMVVDADGSARSIHVDLDSAYTDQGLSFNDEIVAKTNGKHAEEITSELVECLTTEMQNMRFKPRTYNGQALPTMVFVTSHFRSNGISCREIDSEFRTSEGGFGGVVFRDQNSCFEVSSDPPASRKD